MINCDIVICGAGISGLLLASELSKNLSVIVLEKNPRSDCSNKFWLTNEKCLDFNKELKACVDSKWKKMDFISNSRKTFTAKGEYILWNTKQLENHLIDKINKNGSKIFYEHRFYSYKYANNAIVIYANNLTFKASLLIDCMGYSSPIVSSTNVVNIFGYYHLYGRIIQLKKCMSPVAIDNVIISGTPSFLEVFPRSDGYANVVLIAPAKNIKSQERLENDFNFIVRNSHYSEYFVDSGAGEKLHGIVPIGEVKKTSLDRILFFGEAGQVHPAASCTCLNKLLYQYKSLSRSICHKTKNNQLRAKDLKSITIHMNGFSRRFHQNMFKEMIEWSTPQCESFIDLLYCLDKQSIDDLIFGEITPLHFIKIKNLAKAAKKRNFLWVRPFLKSLFR